MAPDLLSFTKCWLASWSRPDQSCKALKHADEATEADREQLKALLSAMEGALMLGLLLQQATTGNVQASEPAESQPALG